MTQAFQLWLNRPTDRLGWPFREKSIMTAYVEPLDTYADMSHLLPAEAWPADERVDDIAYFCGVIEEREGETQESANEHAHDNAIEYLERDARGIWPRPRDRAAMASTGVVWSTATAVRASGGSSRSSGWGTSRRPSATS